MGPCFIVGLDAELDQWVKWNPFARSGPERFPGEETRSGACDPEERAEMANRKGHSKAHAARLDCPV
jgi:hypothetical protein